MMTAAVTASGLALVPAAARAKPRGNGYRLLIQDGIDAVSARELVSRHHRAPWLIGRIAKDVLSRPADLAAIMIEARRERTVVVASPAVAAALETMAGRSIPRHPAIASELARLFPAGSPELLDFA